MPAVTLPLTFTNSFWSQDYRRGLETLFNKLEQGIAENDEIIHFLEARIAAEYDLAVTLTTPPLTGPRGTGFSVDDGASLLMAFWGLKQETKLQGDGHKVVADDLQKLVLEPFGEWAHGHEGRIKDSKTNLLDLWLREYEHSLNEVNKLKATYHAKMRTADEAEDDAKFAPNSDYSDHYTATSPRMNGRNAVVNRTPSVSERIAERLKELRVGKGGDGASGVTIVEPTGEGGMDDTTTALKLDKGKGRAVEETSSPQAMSPTAAEAPLPPLPPAKPSPILLAGIAMTPVAVSTLLRRAHAELPLRSIRLPILGEYPECFSGEEFVMWLKDNVEAFGGDLDRADEAAKDLTEVEGLLRRIGEFGNEFEPSPEAFYQFRPKAFNLEEGVPNPTAANLQPVANNLLKRSGTLANFVMKQIKTGSGQPPYVRAREEAQEADNTYRMAVRRVDRQRLALEDRIEESLKLLQRWEMDRLRAIKDVLLKYHATLSTLTSSFQPSMERASTLIASYQPESDLKALIERYRTGPFRPMPHIYESVSHDGTDVLFGIDLRKWAGDSGWAAVRIPEDEKKDTIPPVLSSLLAALDRAYAKLPSDDERRRSWIYDIPLHILHHLREALNSQPLDAPIQPEFFEKVDAPVLAGIIKLWLLELDPPVGTWEGWDDIKKIYPSVGAKLEVPESQHMENVQNALFKFPKIHLYVLDAIIKHVKGLINSTKSEEDLDVYLSKLGYSLGRAILHPRQETEISIQDRHYTLLFIDLVKHYDTLMPPTIEKKKRESEKTIPVRKRTTLVDQRINRRSVGADTKQLLEAREAQIRAPSPSRATFPDTKPPAPPAPPAPTKKADDDLPPRPKFASPPPEDDDRKSSAAKAPVVVSPATPEPERSQSPTTQKQLESPTSEDRKSPLVEDKPLTSLASSLSRTGSGETSRVRRPGGARGPRAAPGIAAAAATAPSTSPGHTRRGSGSIGGGSPRASPRVSMIASSTAAADPNEYIPKKKGGRTSAGAFGRRTMASGSEDETLDK